MKAERPLNSCWGFLPLIVYILCDMLMNYKMAMLGAFFTTVLLYFILIFSTRYKGFIIGLFISTIALPLFIFHFYLFPEDRATFFIPISAEVFLIILFSYLFFNRKYLYRNIFKWIHQPAADNIARNLYEFNQMAFLLLVMFIIHLAGLALCYFFIDNQILNKPIYRMSGVFVLLTILILREMECMFFSYKHRKRIYLH